MTAEIVLDPAGGKVLRRKYSGIADSDIYRNGVGTPVKVMHSVVSVKGELEISYSVRQVGGPQTETSKPIAGVATTGPQFSANAVWSSNVSGAGQRASVFVRGNLVRVELVVDPSQEQTYLIADQLKRTIVVVSPARRQYVSVSVDSTTGPWSEFFTKQPVIFNNVAPCEVFPQATKCERIGPGTLNGRQVETWQVSQAVDGRILSGHVWVDSRLAVLSKMETPGGTVELQNIREEPQPEGLFSIPAGFVRSPG